MGHVMKIKMLKLILSSILLTLLALFGSCERTDDKLNILFIPLQQKSHLFMLIAIAKELAMRGHNVCMAVGSTFRTHIEDTIIHTGIIILQFQQNLKNEDTDGGNIDRKIALRFFKNKGNAIQDLREIVYILSRMHTEDCDSMWSDVRLIGAPTLDAWRYGQPSLPSFEPHNLLQFSDDMTIFQKMVNLIFSVVDYSNLLNPGQGSDLLLLETYAPGEYDWNTLMNRALLVFVL